MTTIGTFEIEGSFKVADRGLVIYGDIISGTVSKENFFIFNNGQQDVKLKIKGVDILDKIKEKIAKKAVDEKKYQQDDDQLVEATEWKGS